MNASTFVVAAGTLALGLFVGATFIASPPDNKAGPEKTLDGTPEGTPKRTEPSVRWKLSSTFPSGLSVIGEAAVRFERTINLVSNGDIVIKLYEPGALVPPMELFDAVSVGSVDAGWSASAYWAGKFPAAQFFNSVPFGPRIGELVAWMRYGGGQELYEELYHPNNVHGIVCSFAAADGSGWFREEITDLDQLRGMKIRYLGPGALVLDRLGASTQLLAGGDILPALELGVIDGAEFSMPSIDKELGFYQVAKHYYFPGWHQPANLVELIVNLELWQALTDTQRALIETVCGDNLINSVAQGEAIQADALDDLADLGVTFHRWTPEMLATFERTWLEIADEMAAKDPFYAKVWNSLTTFRERYKTWRNLANIQ